MNYPKMLYKGEAKYTDNDQLRNDLFSKELKTIIVADDEQEILRREHGYVDLVDLIYKPKPKVMQVVDPITTTDSPSIEESPIDPEKEEVTRVKRKYTRRIQNVGTDAA